MAPREYRFELGYSSFQLLTLVALLVLFIGCVANQKSDAVPAGQYQIEHEQRPPLLPATQPFLAMARANVEINLAAEQNSFNPIRHTLGVGGVNSSPLPERAIKGAKKLRPRLIRIFIQEFFAIYPEHDRFDWSKLDPYMDALGKTGANVVAAITIKPRPLYPEVDASIWRPNNVEEWQRVVAALVKRYSVDRKLVTHWEIGNEPDIGEAGGCPYLITSAADYLEYYKMTTQAILEAFPQARVGGAAVADASGTYLPEFIRLCREREVRLDFVSWHLYSDDPRAHASLVEKYAKLVADVPGKRPELMVTEWSRGFDAVSVEEQAFDPRRAAMVAATVIKMTDAGVDWSFYYHLHDQAAYWGEFEPFFSDPNIMHHHWNELPHRFGLFGGAGDVRPQYFVYQMLARMPARRVAAHCDQDDLHVLAATGPQRVAVLLSNYGIPTSRDHIVTLRFDGVPAGRKQLVVFRIDRAAAWSSKRLELIPVERRDVEVRGGFTCQTYCPADSVIMAVLESPPSDRMRRRGRR